MNTVDDSYPQGETNLNAEPDLRTGQERFRHLCYILMGQVVSVFGSALTSFSMGVWAFQQSDSVTAYTSIFFAVAIGASLSAPFAGVLVDRWDKRRILMLGTLISASISALIAIFYLLGVLNIWLMVICACVNGIATAFSRPAMNASIKLLIDPNDLARANGVVASAYGFMTLLAPTAAGYLFLEFDLIGILAIDLMTFCVGISALYFLKLPKKCLAPSEPMLKSVNFAWSYLKQHNSLLLLVAFLFIVNFFGAMVLVLIQPLLLSFSDASGLGKMLSISGLGYLAGALLMGTWGGPERKMYLVLASAMFSSLVLIVLPLSTELISFSVGMFFLVFTIPLGMASNNSIIQRKVPSQYIGRIDGLGQLLVSIAIPIGFLCAGPTAELIFEPFMSEENEKNRFVGQFFHYGAGRGIALMLSSIGIILVLMVFFVALTSKVRRIELELEDQE